VRTSADLPCVAIWLRCCGVVEFVLSSCQLVNMLPVSDRNPPDTTTRLIQPTDAAADTTRDCRASLPPSNPQITLR
jgi:hypothetical protein